VRTLIKILGKRAFLSFGLVTFLVAALLATVNITSRYALKLYVEDQLSRIPWDMAMYQRGGALDDEIPNRIREVQGIKQVESLAFLRAQMPEDGAGLAAQVDGKPIVTPWICLLAATDLGLLPPELGLGSSGQQGASQTLRPLPAPANGAAVAIQQSPSEQSKHSAHQEHGHSHEDPTALKLPGNPPPAVGPSPNHPAILSLVGPERSMGNAFLSLQGAHEFTIGAQHSGMTHSLFSTPLQAVIRLDRDELNRWLMDQTGSVSFVPYIGLILLMPYDQAALNNFDSVASGSTGSHDMSGQAGDRAMGHMQTADYVPEITYLARVDRPSLVSGWDMDESLERLSALRFRVKSAANPGIYEEPPSSDRPKTRTDFMLEGSTGVVVDSTTLVLLQRMNRIAHLIGLVTFIVALPLLWIAWVLAANLSRLLMLNERRTLGLMRLRGIPGKSMGRAFLLAIFSGGLLGGVLGLLAGSVVPLMIYERGQLPVQVLAKPEQLLLFLGFLAITLVLALLVSRRLVRYATTISPLEASVRVSGLEAARTAIRFGPLQLLSLLIGGYTLTNWISGFSLASILAWQGFRSVDQALDFVGLPLFVYGVASLVVARRRWIQGLLGPILKPIGGRLGIVALEHLSVKPYRTIGFVLIVSMVATVCLYPTVTGRSFEDKEVRGARVQMGTQLEFTFNSPDLVATDRLRGPLGVQLAAIRPEVDKTLEKLAGVPGVKSADCMLEALLPGFYLPGYGLRGVPIYLIADVDRYAKNIYSEPELGISDTFKSLIARLKSGEVAVSPPVADFWRLSPGTSVLMGSDEKREAVFATAAGTIAFLPGTPPRTVTDRQGYVQARVDYLNYLFSNNAYLVAAADSPAIQNLQVLIPRLIVLINTGEGAAVDSVQSAVASAAPASPLEVHNLSGEIKKVGSDMFISLALANLRIYLLGGLFLALIAIMAVASANYVEDRRTLGLLRIRGASPIHIWRFLVAMLLAPALLGLVIGGLLSLLAGFGLANYVWRLREIKTVVQLLPSNLVLSPLLIGIILLLFGLLIGVASLFSLWVFRRTARERIQEA
jgi:hypothetical protein